jgi:ribonuclease J
MRVRIARGAQQVGGTCIEVEARGERLVLDAGLPLDDDIATPAPLPEVPGLFDEDGHPPLALVLSHGHLDHVGLVPRLRDGVPVAVGRDTCAVARAASLFSPMMPALPDPGWTLRDAVPLGIGPFRVTPFLVDHSAFDAYALLVEAAGRRLLYTGDLRAQGRKPWTWRRLLASPPRGVDALLMEGTHVHPDADPDAAPYSEDEVERDLTALLVDTPGNVAVASSAQDVDRLVSAYRASLRSGRTPVIDLYTASLLAALPRPTLPRPGAPRLRVLVPRSQRGRVCAIGEFGLVDAVRPHRIFPEEVAGRRDLCLLTRSGGLRELLADDALAGGAIAWSMWAGYLDRDDDLRAVIARSGLPLTRIHASGHAAVRDLRRLASAIAPRAVVPVHTGHPELFGGLMPAVRVRGDGEWWRV